MGSSVQENWRKQKGIDSRVRRKFKGCGVVQPNIGYGTNKKHRHVLPNGAPSQRQKASIVQRCTSSAGSSLLCCQPALKAANLRLKSDSAVRNTHLRLCTSRFGWTSPRQGCLTSEEDSCSWHALVA